MAQDRIDSIIDLGAIEAEIKKVQGLTKELAETLKRTPKIKAEISGSQSIKEFSAATAKMQQEVKAVINLANQRFAAEAKVVALQTNYAKATANAREETRKLNTELKNQAQVQQAQTGSIEKARALIKQYTIERDKLNLATEEGQKRQAVLNERINKFNEFIKKNVSSLEQQKINVGNYAGSLAKPFESLQKKLEEIRANLQKGIGLSGTTNPADLKSAEIAINAINNAISVSSTTSATASKQVRALENAYQALTITTAKGDSVTNTFLKDLAVEIGEAKDQVQDLKDEIKLNASDTKGIDNLVGSLNALAGIAQGAAGAYALFGANQEEAAKVTSKLIAVQGIANSIQQVGQEVTRRGSIANKIYEASVETLSVAFGKGSTAAQRWSAILKVGIAGVAIAGLIVLVSYLTRAAQATDDAGRRQKAYNETLAEAGDAYKEAVTEIQNLRLAFDQAKQGIVSQDQAVKLYNETIGKTTGQVKSLEEAEKELAKNADAYIKFTLLKAQANIALGKAAEEAFKAQQLQLFQQQLLAKGSDNNLLGAVIDKALTESTKKGADLLDLYKKIIEESNKLAKDFKFNPLGNIDATDASAKAQKISDNTAQQILQEQFERQKILLNRSIANNQAIYENEANSYEERLSALRLFTADQMALIEAERQFAIASEKLRIKAVIEGLEEQKKAKGADIKAIGEQEAKERNLSAEKLKTIEAKAKDDILGLQTEFNAGLRRLALERKSIREQEQKDAEKAGGTAYLDNISGQADAEIEIVKDKNKTILENTLSTYSQIRDALAAFLSEGVEQEKAALDAKKQLIDENAQKRIAQINALGLTESERLRQVSIVEKQAAAQTEQIERRKRQLAVERARFQRIVDIGGIITGASQAVVAALGQKPFTPANIALAAAVGAIGLAQLVKAIAAPLPRFFKGKKKNDPYSGPGVVNDGPNMEAIERKEGFIEYPKGKNVVTYLRAGDIVHPDAGNFIPDNKRLMRNMISMASPYSQIMQRRERSRNDYMTESTGQAIVKELRNIDPSVRIFQTISAPIESTMSWQKAFR